MKKNKSRLPLAAGVLLVLVTAAAFFAAGYFKDRSGGGEEQAEAEKPAVSQASDEDEIFYNGKTYRYRKELQNVLFLGIDKGEPAEIQETAGTAGQADCIMLLSFDRDTGEAKVLQISRDSMTDVDIYDINGEYYTSVNAQIAAQYAYGKGEKSSCWAMEKTVSELLYDLPIDGYVSMTVDAIGLATDAVGGVTLTLTEDCTDLDPTYLKGTVLNLNGEQAEQFVRYRDTSVQGSNSQRMRRQVQFIPALLKAVREKAGDSGNYYGTLYPLLAEYMVTDLTADQLNSLGQYEPDLENVLYVPGEIRRGEEHEEFHVDDEALRELLIRQFYEPAG